MTDDISPDPKRVRANLWARFSAISSIFFLIPTLVIVASNGFLLSTSGNKFFKDLSDDSAIKFVIGLLFEVTYLALPITFLTCLIILLIGVRGLRFATRSGAGVGRRESFIGIGLALFVMAICVLGSAHWASGWRQ